MERIAGMRCWDAGDDDHSVIESDMISNEREDLLAALWGAGSSWDATLGCRGKNNRRDATWKG